MIGNANAIRRGLFGEECGARVLGFKNGRGVVIMAGGLLWSRYFVLPTSFQRRLHETITGQSPAFELLAPEPD